MAATFNPALTTPRDRARQYLGDTNVAKAEFPDETYDYWLGIGRTALATATQLAYDAEAKYARQADITVDDQRQMVSHIAKAYRALADRLSGMADPDVLPASAAAPGIFVGGLEDCRGPIDRCDPCNWPSAGWRC